MKKVKKNKIPKFQNEDQERKFWAVHDSAEYVDWSAAKRVRFSNLKPSERAISIRMPEFLVADLKFLANKQGVPYQSLLKVFVAEKVRDAFSGKR